MAGNNLPIFSKIGSISSGAVTAANVKSDGAGTIATDIFVAFTSDATNGGYVQRLRWSPVANTANTVTTATVGRVFISQKTTGATTRADTWLWSELTLPSITADSSTSQANVFDIPMGFALPAGYTILVTNHAAPAANSTWLAIVIGGSY